MIDLFNIPDYIIDTSKFTHYLHGDIVDKFEENFREYVGAKYSCSVNSATNAIFLLLLNKHEKITVPTLIPPVVLNAIVLSNNTINFCDNINWVGNAYELYNNNYKIIDSAQAVYKDQYKNYNDDNAVMFFSFYPTKPISSCDGGIIVSNNKTLIDDIKILSFNGMTQEKDNWNRTQTIPGYKFYMNSIQAYIANENLKKLENKKYILSKVREKYNNAFNLNNNSEHLYRINVQNRDKFIHEMKTHGISCGIHYVCQHTSVVFKQNQCLPLSEKESMHTVSIPYHENLITKDIDFIIKTVLACVKN